MKFHTRLVGINTQATLTIHQVMLNVNELRYAVDVATLDSLAHAWTTWLQGQGYAIAAPSEPSSSSRPSVDPSDWFLQGVPCEMRSPDAVNPQTGRLQLRVSLEFVPDAADRSPHQLLEPPTVAANTVVSSDAPLPMPAAQAPAKQITQAIVS